MLARHLAQATAQGGVEAAPGFAHALAAAVHVEHPERRRRLLEIAEAFAEVGLVLGLGHGAGLGDEVAVRGRRRQAFGLADQQPLHFLEQQLDGVVVVGDVMVQQREQPLALFGVERGHRRQQRRPAQVEADAARVGAFAQPLQRARAGFDLDHLQAQRRLAMHDLDRLEQALPAHRGAQDVVAVDHRLQGAQECVQALAGVEGQHRAQQVGVAAVAVEQVVEQDALLQRRERVDVLDIADPARHARDDAVDLVLGQRRQRQQLGGDRDGRRRDRVGRDRRGRRDPVRADALGQIAERRRGEHRAHVGFQAMLAQPFNHADHQQRVAAEFEETVVAADLFEVQQFLPDLRNGLLDLAARRLVFARQHRAVVRRRQRLAVELAVGGQRHRIEHNERARQHVVG